MKDKENLTFYESFGGFPKESGLKKKMRLHQGWWRTCVLAEKADINPKEEKETICNRIVNGKSSKSNFLTENIYHSVCKTLDERKIQGLGIIEEKRLFNNLLSSQPLCFNFFGELYMDTDFGLSVLKTFYPKLTKLRRVLFEFAPQEKYTNDNSAFDVAFEVEEEDKIGLIGWECKYTDTFSPTRYDKIEYSDIFSKSDCFSSKYKELIHPRINQLFRNQLIAESLKQNNKYAFVYTGLFCMHEDLKAIETAKYFKSLLNPKTSNFNIITYNDFITNVQKLDIDWEKREWTMLLWARYCGTVLSKSTVNKLINLK